MIKANEKKPIDQTGVAAFYTQHYLPAIDFCFYENFDDTLIPMHEPITFRRAENVYNRFVFKAQVDPI